MKADVVKSEKLRSIIHLMLLPPRFLWSCVSFVFAFGLKPHPQTLKKFSIRVVALEDDKTWGNHLKVYTALELLNRHDQEKLELIKKYFRIICVMPTTNLRGCYYWGNGVCFCCLKDLHKIPAEKHVGTIIWWLVDEVSRLKFAGKFGAFLRPSKAVKDLCKEELRRTMQKFCE